jgi:Heat shock factor binding protein 1
VLFCSKNARYFLTCFLFSNYLLQQSRFQAVNESILTRLEVMNSKIEELEKTLTDLSAAQQSQAPVENPNVEKQ